MPEKFRRFFLNDADATLNFAQGAFREVYNRYFGDEDYYITESEDRLNAQLRALIQTIEIVGDDELELSWQDFVEFQTGFRPSMPGAEILSFKIARAGMASRMFKVEDNTAYAHFARTFKHSVRRNRLAAQGGVLIEINGCWSNPLVDGGGVGSPTINRLTNRDDWLIREMDESSSNIGQLSSSEASINLFEGGEVYVPDTTQSGRHLAVHSGDLDIGQLDETSNDADDISESGQTEASSAPSYYEFFNENWLGASFLTDINFT